MKSIQNLKNVDIYLLDQALKDRIPKKGQILDAGCGKGRNFAWLADQHYPISGFDPNEAAIQSLKERYPAYAERLSVSRTEDFKSDFLFDFIICNAVLHFAADHKEFNAQFSALAKLLNISGTLFIRMTCTMGLDIEPDAKGRRRLADGTDRYLLRYDQIDALCSAHNLALLEPVKAVWVNGERSMATLVFTRID